jgi:hypothetical protein
MVEVKLPLLTGFQILGLMKSRTGLTALVIVVKKRFELAPEGLKMTMGVAQEGLKMMMGVAQEGLKMRVAQEACQ